MSEEKPKCLKCGGSGRVPKPMTKPPHPCNYVNILRSEETMPCPVCQPKEQKPGEFVKHLRTCAKFAGESCGVDYILKANAYELDKAADRIENLQEKLYFAEQRIKRDKIAIEQLQTIVNLTHDIHTRDPIYVRNKWGLKDTSKALAGEFLCTKIEQLKEAK